VRVPVQVRLILRRPAEDGQKGSATAARQLPDWIQNYPPQDDSFALRLTRAGTEAERESLLAIAEAGCDVPAASCCFRTTFPTH